MAAKKLTSEQKQELYTLGKKGMLHKDIAKKLNVSEGLVSRYLIDAGITRYATKHTWQKEHKGM